MAYMNVAVHYEGTDYSEYLISYDREKNICTGIGTAKVSFDISQRSVFGLYKVITIYEGGSKRGTFYVASIEPNATEGTVTLICQDGSKKLQDYFIAEQYFINYPSYSYLWIKQFCDEAGISTSFATTESTPLPNDTYLGTQTAYEQIMYLLQINGWFMRFDANNTCVIGSMDISVDDYDIAVHDADILQIHTQKDDKMYRNKAIVYGMGSPDAPTGWIHASLDLHGQASNEYDSTNDLRPVVMGSSYIDDTETAYGLAAQMMREFHRITEVCSVEVAGAWDLDLGTQVLVDSKFRVFIGTTTSFTVSFSRDGLVTAINLNQRCPRLFGYFNYGGYVYAGTESSGIWRKHLKWDHTWTSFNTGLTSDYIYDLKVLAGVFACNAGQEAYVRNSAMTAWVKVVPSTFTDSINNVIYSYADVIAGGVNVNSDDYSIDIIYTNRTYNVSWVVKVNSYGTIISTTQIKVLYFTDERNIRAFDVDNFSTDRTVTGVLPGDSLEPVDRIQLPPDGIGWERLSYVDPEIFVYNNFYYKVGVSSNIAGTIATVTIEKKTMFDTGTFATIASINVDITNPFGGTNVDRGVSYLLAQDDSVVYIAQKLINSSSTDNSYLFVFTADVDALTASYVFSKQAGYSSYNGLLNVNRLYIFDHYYYDCRYIRDYRTDSLVYDTAFDADGLSYFPDGIRISHPFLRDQNNLFCVAFKKYSGNTYAEYTKVLWANVRANKFHFFEISQLHNVSCESFNNPITDVSMNENFSNVRALIKKNSSPTYPYYEINFITETVIDSPTGSRGNSWFGGLINVPGVISDTYYYPNYKNGSAMSDVTHLIGFTESASTIYMLHVKQYSSTTFRLFKRDIMGGSDILLYSYTANQYIDNHTVDQTAFLYQQGTRGARARYIKRGILFYKFGGLLNTTMPILDVNYKSSDYLPSGALYLLAKEAGADFEITDYTTGPTVMELDTGSPLITYPLPWTNYLLSGISPSGTLFSGELYSGLYQGAMSDFRISYTLISGDLHPLFVGDILTQIPLSGYVMDARGMYIYNPSGIATLSGIMNLAFPFTFSTSFSGIVNFITESGIYQFSLGTLTQLSGYAERLETTNYQDFPYIFISTSGDRYRFFQRDGFQYNDIFDGTYYDRTNNLPNSKVTIIRCDDRI